MKKYEFTGETKVFAGVTLRRIRALCDFGNISVGDVGGWIESEGNLSHYGDCWVYDEALVYSNAHVYGNARVGDNARVYGNARVGDNARVYGQAWAGDNARVYGSAKVSGDAEVYGSAKVSGDAEVYGSAEVCGDAEVLTCRHILVIGPIGSRDGYTTFFRGADNKIYVSCGCFRGDIDEFLNAVAKTHGDNKFAQGYRMAAELAKTAIELG